MVLFRVATVLPIGLAACMTAAAPASDSLSGRWSGAVGIVEYAAQLVEQGSNLSGNGTIGPTPTSGAAFPTRLASVSGTYRAPAVELTFASGTSALATFSGVREAADTITGTIQVDGAPPAPLTLYRR